MPSVSRLRRVPAPPPGRTTRALATLIATILVSGVLGAATRAVSDGRDETVAATGPTSTTTPGLDAIDVPDVTVTLPSIPPVTLPPITLPPTTSTTRPQPPSLRGQILFIRRPVPPQPTTGPVTPSAYGYSVWIMSIDGSGAWPLIDGGYDASPDLSPDGRRVAWISNDREIWTMSSSGADRRKVATCPLSCGEPKWSPDGSRLTYVPFQAGDGWGSITVVRADGTDPRTYPSPGAEDYSVAWSPDATRLAVTGHAGGRGLTILDLATGERRVIRSETSLNPSWHPDGSRILFDDMTDVHTIAPDGSGLTRLTSGPGQRFAGDWSPDGRLIAFDVSSHTVEPQVAVMNADGSGQRLLTDGTVESSDAAF